MSGQATQAAPGGGRWMDGLPRVSGEQRDGAVVPRAANALLEDAEDMLALAMARADALTVEVDEARQAAHAEGFEAGRADAQAELAREIHALRQKTDAYLAQAKGVIADLAIEAAQRATRRTLTPEAAEAAAAEVIAEHLDQGPYALHVHADSHPMAVGALQRLAETHPGATLPQVQVDVRLTPGRVVLATRHGLIDLDADAQFRALRAALTSTASTRA